MITKYFNDQTRGVSRPREEILEMIDEIAARDDFKDPLYSKAVANALRWAAGWSTDIAPGAIFEARRRQLKRNVEATAQQKIAAIWQTSAWAKIARGETVDE